MKKLYEAPTLIKAAQLADITAEHDFLSPAFSHLIGSGSSDKDDNKKDED